MKCYYEANIKRYIVFDLDTIRPDFMSRNAFCSNTTKGQEYVGTRIFFAARLVNSKLIKTTISKGLSQ